MACFHLTYYVHKKEINVTKKKKHQKTKNISTFSTSKRNWDNRQWWPIKWSESDVRNTNVYTLSNFEIRCDVIRGRLRASLRLTQNACFATIPFTIRVFYDTHIRNDITSNLKVGQSVDSIPFVPYCFVIDKYNFFNLLSWFFLFLKAVCILCTTISRTYFGPGSTCDSFHWTWSHA